MAESNFGHVTRVVVVVVSVERVEVVTKNELIFHDCETATHAIVIILILNGFSFIVDALI